MHDELQKRFGNEQIQFSNGNGGLTKVSIANSVGRAEIYLHGAQVTSFQPAGQKELMYLSSTSAFQSDKAIRGGVPICWPWFGPSATDPKLPLHGVARLNAWSVESTNPIDDQHTSITFRLEANDATRKLWPHDFLVRYTVTVGSALEMELETTNREKSGIMISEALHTYFLIGDIEQAALGGLTGTSYYDKANNARRIEERDPVKLTAETDNVYLNTRTAVVINDPLMGRKIRMEKSGSNTTVVWNPFGPKTMADVGPGEWKKFICVEAVNAMENTVTVAPGATHKMGKTIKVM